MGVSRGASQAQGMYQSSPGADRGVLCEAAPTIPGRALGTTCGVTPTLRANMIPMFRRGQDKAGKAGYMVSRLPCSKDPTFKALDILETLR